MSNKGWFLSLSIGCCLLAAGRGAFSAAEVGLFEGEDLASQRYTLGGMGSGSADLTAQNVFTGTAAIRIRSDGYYSPGRIDFTPGVDLTDALADPTGYLVMEIQFPPLAAQGDSGGDTPSPAYGRGYGYPPAGSDSGGGASSQNYPSYMRLTLNVSPTPRGPGQPLVAEDVLVDPTKTEDGWTRVAAPLSGFKGPRPAGAHLYVTQFLIGGDIPATYMVGEIRTELDDEPITIDALDEQEANVGDIVQLTATAHGALATLQYIWDFDARDGIQDDAFGQNVEHIYRDPGTYTVTLRVRDVNGVKKEASATTTVTIDG